MPAPWWTKEKLIFAKKTFKNSFTVREALTKLQEKWGREVTADSFRAALKRKHLSGSLETLLKRKKIAKKAATQTENRELEILLDIINKKTKKKDPISFRDLCNSLDLSPGRVEELIEDAIKLGYKINVSSQEIILDKESKLQDVIPKVSIPKIKSSKTDRKRLRLAVISDTHAGSSAALPDQVSAFVNMAYDKYGVRTILHAGDILTGNSVYRDQISELNIWGCQSQCEEASKMLPERDGLKYHVILGNHDINFIKSAGIDPGFVLSKMRKDINILGHLKATFVIDPANIMIELIHIKSTAHARSYVLEKHLAKSISKGQYPDVVFAGHRHVGGYFILNSIHCFMCPCFEDENMFVKYNDFAPSVGGIIVDFVLDENNKIVRCDPSFHMSETKNELSKRIESALLQES